jgi:UDP-N-acetylglucosamine 2-epimerase (non-hydrolysing)
VNTRTILFIFGTRPEAIKLCPVVQYLAARPEYFNVRVCVTAQHREMLDQVLAVFEVRPDYDLGVMQSGQTLFQSTARILAALEPVIAENKPDMVMVQGDTTTTLCGALAGFYANVAVGHIEAGLRTGDMRQPFPEEMNRVVAARLTDLHFAATAWAADNLRAEGVPAGNIYVTGNSGMDAVLRTRDLLESGVISGPQWHGLDSSKRLIVVTAHRRESFGEGFERICAALAELAARRPDIQLVYPVHPNPNVTGPVYRHLQGRPNILLIEPLDYVAFVDLMRRAHLLITDSGGIQEEGPSLGKPILVLREKTERPEAVEAGTVTLVGSDVRRIVDTALWLLDDAAEYDRRSHIHNPYGDGRASERIAGAIRAWFGDAAAAMPNFS